MKVWWQTLLMDKPRESLTVVFTISSVKRDVKSIVSVEENRKMLEHVQKLVNQGKFLELSKTIKRTPT